MAFEFTNAANGDLVVRRTGKIDLCYARDLLGRRTDEALVEILRLTGFDPYELAVLSEHQVAEIGGLTSAPVLAEQLGIADDGTIDELGNVYWYPNYMISDPVREILRGECVFDKAEA